jgi:hypothetical protein
LDLNAARDIYSSRINNFGLAQNRGR